MPGRRGKHLRVGLHLHDVFVFGHRPERPELAVVGEMHRIVAPQPGEPVGPDVVLKNPRVGDVDLLERHRPWIAQRGIVQWI